MLQGGLRKASDMNRPRIATAAVVVLSAAWLVSAPAVAERTPRGLTASPQPVLTGGTGALVASASHGAYKQDQWNVLDEPSYTNTLRSSYSGTLGAEGPVIASQDTTIDTFDDSGTPRVKMVSTTGRAESSAGPPKQASPSQTQAFSTLNFSVQSEEFLHVIVEGTLRAAHNAGGYGCAGASLQIIDSASEFHTFAANTGGQCLEPQPGGGTTAIVEEFQFLPGTTQFTLYGSANDFSFCEGTDCDQLSKGSATWDFDFIFCSNSYTDGSDLVLGTAGSDVLCGGLGADEIHGLDGDDVVVGDAGDDIVTGGFGNDVIRGEGGNDELWGESEETCASIDGGNDDLFPGPGRNDELHGCGGNDFFLEGSSFGVVAFGGPGADAMAGGGGPDLFRGGAGPDLLGGFSGNDTLRGEGGNDQIYGHAGGDLTDGGPGSRDLCRPGSHRDDRRVRCER
jgi:Ca2+-binding RTX toxin-like protein